MDTPGSNLGVEPVAMTTSVAESSLPSTDTEVPDRRTAVPCTTSTFRALMSEVRPETSLSTIRSSKALTASQSGEPLAFTPHSSARLTVSRTSADRSNALVGMHPLSKQVPPSLPSRSTRATRLPSSADRKAHEYPPVPEPITTTS